MKLFREGRHFGHIISLTCLIFYLALTDDFFSAIFSFQFKYMLTYYGIESVP